LKKVLSFEIFSDKAVEFLILFDGGDPTVIQRQNKDLRTKFSIYQLNLSKAPRQRVEREQECPLQMRLET